MRADSGFYNHAVVAACRALDVRFSVTIRQQPNVRTLIERYRKRTGPRSRTGSTTAPLSPRRPTPPFQHMGDATAVRLIVRRVQPTPGSQLALFVHYSYHAFITDRAGEMMELEADHRRHAEIENAIRDLKYGVTGSTIFPRAASPPTAPGSRVQVIAHNLARWTARGWGSARASSRPGRSGGATSSPDGSPTRHGAGPCTSRSAGPGPGSWQPRSCDYGRIPAPGLTPRSLC